MAKFRMTKKLLKSDANLETPFAIIDKTLKRYKKIFNIYMTKLGAHTYHLAGYMVKRFFKLIKNSLVKAAVNIKPYVLKFFNIIMHLGEYSLGMVKSFGLYYINLVKNFKKVKNNVGILGAIRITGKTLLNTLAGYRKVLITAFNIAAPVASIVFLFNIVSYAKSIDYVVKVEYNGQELGYVSAENVIADAEKLMQERIVYLDDNDVPVTVSPTISIIPAKTRSVELVDEYDLADKFISNSDSDIIEASGFYIDDKFFGALEDEKGVQEALAKLLAKYDASGNKSAKFQNDIQFKEGIYLTNTIVDEDEIIELITSEKQVEKYYTIVEGDCPSIIAQKNNMSYKEFLALNPNIESECKVGNKALLSRAEPYLSVEVTVVENYTSSINYDTVKENTSSLYKGQEKVQVQGVKGEAKVTAEVTYVNGYEVGRTILKQTVTKEPVTQKVLVGTKSSTVSSSVAQQLSGNGNFLWPAGGGYISQYYSRYHGALDIAAPYGTPIYAAADGVVTTARYRGSFGNLIVISHGGGVETYYAHQSKMVAWAGKSVKKGELIGYVGSTGRSTGNHLHFEIRSGGVQLNPIKYLSK